MFSSVAMSVNFPSSMVKYSISFIFDPRKLGESSCWLRGEEKRVRKRVAGFWVVISLGIRCVYGRQILHFRNSHIIISKIAFSSNNLEGKE